MNDWKSVWNRRSVDASALQSPDSREIFLELKRANGFDIMGNPNASASQSTVCPGWEGFYEQFLQTNYELGANAKRRDFRVKSVFEIGCGSGANLYLFAQDGVRVGGLDYSQSLLEAARAVLPPDSDLLCDEADRLPVEPRYDATFSNGVFSYFYDFDYAKTVLELMVQKAVSSIGVMDIHDAAKREAFFAYRNRITPDYRTRYRNLPKLFYLKSFFLEFAESHGLDIKFSASNMKGYWNNEFVFHCFFYKQG